MFHEQIVQIIPAEGWGVLATLTDGVATLPVIGWGLIRCWYEPEDYDKNPQLPKEFDEVELIILNPATGSGTPIGKLEDQGVRFRIFQPGQGIGEADRTALMEDAGYAPERKETGRRKKVPAQQ